MTSYEKEQIKKEMKAKAQENDFFRAIENAPEKIKSLPIHYKKVIDFLFSITPDGCRASVTKMKSSIFFNISYTDYSVTSYLLEKPLADFAPKYNEVLTDEEIKKETARYIAEKRRIEKEIEVLHDSLKIDYYRNDMRMFI